MQIKKRVICNEKSAYHTADHVENGREAGDLRGKMGSIEVLPQDIDHLGIAADRREA